ncbi:MAG: hypothetical protein RLZZ69_3343 [Cyanobacteriota bacterium]
MIFQRKIYSESINEISNLFEGIIIKEIDKGKKEQSLDLIIDILYCSQYLFWRHPLSRFRPVSQRILQQYHLHMVRRQVVGYMKVNRCICGCLGFVEPVQLLNLVQFV